MLAIAAGGNNPARWQVDGLSPLTFLQDTNLAVSAANSGNAPEYYALCILAYRAANRTDLLTSAGSTQIDLVGKLESYQVADRRLLLAGDPGDHGRVYRDDGLGGARSRRRPSERPVGERCGELARSQPQHHLRLRRRRLRFAAQLPVEHDHHVARHAGAGRRPGCDERHGGAERRGLHRVDAPLGRRLLGHGGRLFQRTVYRVGHRGAAHGDHRSQQSSAPVPTRSWRVCARRTALPTSSAATSATS